MMRELNLCKFLGVEENQVFGINGCTRNYRIHNNTLQTFYVYEGVGGWHDDSLSVNILIECGITSKLQLTGDEWEHLEAADVLGFKYITKDGLNCIHFHEKKPTLDGDYFVSYGSYMPTEKFDNIIQAVTCHSIQDLLNDNFTPIECEEA